MAKRNYPDNGYGSGVSNSYIVTKIYKNKKKEVNKAEVAKIYAFDKDHKSVKYIDAKYKSILDQAGDKEGTWKWQGTNSKHMIYSVRWGEVFPYDIGYMK